MATRVEQLNSALRKLRSTSPDVQGAAVVSVDGFIIASDVHADLDEELVAGIASAAIGVGNRVTQELLSAELEQAFFRSATGFVILQAIDDDSTLVVLTGRQAKLGLIFIDVRRAVETIRQSM